VLTPPSKFTKKIGQGILPSPLRDLPLSDPPASDPYWKSLRGWESKETVKEFIKYVTKVVEELKDQVDYWVTIGEPVASVIGAGYIAGLWPPGFLLDGNRAKNVLHNLIEAHVQAYDKISSLDDIDADGDGKSKMVGFSHAMVAVSPATPNKLLRTTINNNEEAAKNFVRGSWNFCHSRQIAVIEMECCWCSSFRYGQQEVQMAKQRSGSIRRRI
jgi:hypothetical protein